MLLVASLLGGILYRLPSLYGPNLTLLASLEGSSLFSTKDRRLLLPKLVFSGGGQSR